MWRSRSTAAKGLGWSAVSGTQAPRALQLAPCSPSPSLLPLPSTSTSTSTTSASRPTQRRYSTGFYRRKRERQLQLQREEEAERRQQQHEGKGTAELPPQPQGGNGDGSGGEGGKSSWLESEERTETLRAGERQALRVGLPFALVLFAIVQGSALFWDNGPATPAVDHSNSERMTQSEDDASADEGSSSGGE